MRMTGASMQAAPSAVSFSVSADACTRARVTRILLPKSGRVAGRSNQRRLSRSLTTSPTMKIAGGRIPARTTVSAASPTVVT